MIRGSRLVVPDGFRGLSMDVVYYVLFNSPALNITRLVFFIDEGKRVTAHSLSIPSDEFESALIDGAIVDTGEVDFCPPWLLPFRGQLIENIEDRRKSHKRSYTEIVDQRYLTIAELVADSERIISSNDPNTDINRHARNFSPRQNTPRVRLWFYTYLTFGMSRWSLLPLYNRIGRWDRHAHPNQKKPGRPSCDGKRSGFVMTKKMEDECWDGYQELRQTAWTLDKKYRETIKKKFKCTSIRKGKNDFFFIQPQGLPFPSRWQFEYAIKKRSTRKQRRVGSIGVKRTKAVSGAAGSFAEMLTNLNQQVEFDGYNITEKLTGLTEGSAADGFCVVRAVCGLTGMVVGIGFSHGAENLEAYRMALFCMALDKRKFAELFGIYIEREEWPCIGLPMNLTFDRGPAACFDTEPEISWMTRLDLTPIYSGQSKATVESSHPRNKHKSDEPEYFHSALNYVEMAKREIRQVLKDNSTSNAEKRITEEMIIEGVEPSPLGMWDYLDSRFRNNGIAMSFEDAVRNFLPKHDATIKSDGVYLHGRKFRSPKFDETGAYDLVASDQVIHTTAYALNMCVRHIWIEYAGHLYELDFVRTALHSENAAEISLRELKELEKIASTARAKLAEKSLALAQYHEDRHEEDTGKRWNAGKHRRGKPKNNAATARDREDHLHATGKKS